MLEQIEELPEGRGMESSKAVVGDVEKLNVVRFNETVFPWLPTTSSLGLSIAFPWRSLERHGLPWARG